MKAPTVATLYPRHGDFAATNGSAPTCSVTPDLGCGALPRGGRPSGPGHGAYTCLARLPGRSPDLHLVHVAAQRPAQFRPGVAEPAPYGCDVGAARGTRWGHHGARCHVELLEVCSSRSAPRGLGTWFRRLVGSRVWQP